MVKLLFWGVWNTSFHCPLTPRSVNTVRVTFMGQIELFKNYLYSIGPYAKKKLKKYLHKNMNWVYNECDSLTSWHKIKWFSQITACIFSMWLLAICREGCLDHFWWMFLPNWNAGTTCDIVYSSNNSIQSFSLFETYKHIVFQDFSLFKLGGKMASILQTKIKTIKT